METSDQLLYVFVLCDRLIDLELELRQLPQPNLPPELLPQMRGGREQPRAGRALPSHRL